MDDHQQEHRPRRDAPALLTEIQHAAEEEHRSPGEMVQDAVEQYLEHRRWQNLVLSHEDQLLVVNALLIPA